MIDVAEAIDFEAEQVIYRAGDGKHGAYTSDGRWLPATSDPVTISAAVMPTRGQDLRDLPEGIRDEARYAIYTRAAIDTDGIIETNGRRYRILFIWDRYFHGAFNKGAMGLLK